MKISKMTGVILSLLIMSPYVFFYHEWIKRTQYSVELTGVFFVGILLHFFRNIEAGTSAELLFAGKSLKPYRHFWEDGPCLVPSLLPVLHNIGIYPLWNLKKNSDVTRPDFNPNINITHYKDQRLPVYKVNADASLFALSIHNFFGRAFEWFFFPFQDTSELKYQRLGFRVIILAMLSGFVVNLYSSVSATIKEYNPFQEKNALITVTTQLTDGENHPFPNRELFIEEGGNDKMIYSDIGDVHFILYQKRTDGRLARVQVGTKLCSVVPAGKSIVYETMYKPVHAVNMKNEVYYTKKEELLTIFEKVYLLVTGDKTYRTSSTWTYLNANWLNSVDASYTLIAEALDSNDIPDSNAKGGMVCF